MLYKFISLKSLLLIVSAVYIMFLAVDGTLNYYIHPRYIVFTVVMSVLCCAIVGMYEIDSKPSHTHDKERKLSFLPAAVMLVAALILPASTLSTATVSQRRTDSGSIVSSDSESIESLFSGSSRGLRLNDWARLISINTDEAFYTTRPAKISGFTYDAGLGSNTAWLARFMLTCCAIDAQPVGVPVEIQDWDSEYGEEKWIEVEGIFELRDTPQGEQLVLIPNSRNVIQQPENPYAN